MKNCQGPSNVYICKACIFTFLQIIFWSSNSALSSIRCICICFQVTRQWCHQRGKTNKALEYFALTLPIFWWLNIIWVHCGLRVSDFWSICTALLCVGRKVIDWARKANSWLIMNNLKFIWKSQRNIWKQKNASCGSSQKGVAWVKPRVIVG